jgi:hypothetical protein
MFSAMFHTHNKSEDLDVTSNPTTEPLITQSLSYSTFMGVQDIPPNQRILHLQQQDVRVNLPNGVVALYMVSILVHYVFFQVQTQTLLYLLLVFHLVYKDQRIVLFNV